MKVLISSLCLLALATASSLAQSGNVLSDRAKTLLPRAKPTGEPPMATFARGLLDTVGNVVVRAASGSLVFDGVSRKDNFQATLTLPDPAGRLTWAMPNASGTFTLEAAKALAAASSITVAPGSATVLTLTPGQDETLNLSATGLVAGHKFTIVVTTSGTTSRTLTFGSNFKTTGTLATGTTAAKVFSISFVFDGTNAVELGRTTAM